MGVIADVLDDSLSAAVFREREIQQLVLDNLPGSSQCLALAVLTLPFSRNSDDLSHSAWERSSLALGTCAADLRFSMFRAVIGTYLYPLLLILQVG